MNGHSGEDAGGEIVDGVHRMPRTGISILVVGAGVGGLFMALEGWRQGHDVRVLEKAHSLELIGDGFGLVPSGLVTLQHFPKMKEQFEKESYDVVFSIWSWQGQKLLDLGEAEWNQPGRTHAAKNVRVPWIEKRSNVMGMLEAQCLRLGIEILYDKNVTAYDEDESKAWATTADGEVFHADVLVAADGVGTKSHKHVTGKPMKATSSGYAVFRGMIPINVLNEGLSEAAKTTLLSSARGEFRIYVAKDMHINFIPTRDFVCYILTHKDNGGSEESWHTSCSAENVLKVMNEIPDWNTDLLEALSLTPEKGVLDWKLLWRNPQPQWASNGGRVIQLGDAAHSFLPTSGNGATQALEDGLSLATCLRLGGKKGLQLSTKAHVKLRFQRVSTLQRTGFANRAHWHAMDLNALREDPAKFKMGSWIWAHNALQYAEDRYNDALRAVKEGTELENTNLPLGHVYEPWTIEKEMEHEKTGKPSTLWDTGKWAED